MLAGSAYAYPIEIRVSGIVDSGRAVVPSGDLIDIAGLPYTVTFITDTDSPDHGGSPNSGAFWDFLGVRVEIGTLGRLAFTPPDAITKYDDGNSAWLTSFWSGGEEGLMAINAPAGSFGNPHHLLPFPPLHVTSALDSVVNLGGYATDFWPKGAISVWFESKISMENPVNISSARVPDGGSTLWQFGMAVLSMLYGIRLRRRRGGKKA